MRTAAETINNFDESVSTNDDDILITKEEMIDHFGQIYATDPFNFRFQSGEIILIKEMVKHVKQKLGSQQKNELKLFKTCESKKTQKCNTKSLMPEPAIAKLKSDLVQGVIDCMTLYGAAYLFDGEMDLIIGDTSVEVQIQKGGAVYGTVCCAICDVEKKKQNKPKRVYYNNSSKWPCWVLSNFTKHLKTVHDLKPNREPKTKKSQLVAMLPQEKQESDNGEQKELNESDVVFVEEEVHVDVVAENGPESVHANKTISAISMFTQMKDQINTMMQAVLENSDKREDMGFMMNNSMEKLNVVEVLQDGNCLFSALAHQLHGLKILSKTHKTHTRQLRKRVVDFILNPKNFPKFLHDLKDRVYQTKTKDEIENIETECKLWVKYSLAKNGTWGGAETICAVAELEQVNVIIFNEHGDFYTLRNMKQFDRTICIAYRLQRNQYGDIIPDAILYHYDSVCDIESSTLLNAANVLESRLK